MIRSSERYKILDNGVFEEKEPHTDDLLEIARSYHVNEIVLPDWLGDGQKTYNSHSSFLHSLSNKERKEFIWMLVPQGSSPQDWMHMYVKYSSDFFCEDYKFSIGVPRIFPERELAWRILCLETLREEKALMKAPHHLLGLDDPAELVFLPFVRSVDTRWPFYLNSKYPGIRTSTVSESVEDIEWNIEILRKFAKNY